MKIEQKYLLYCFLFYSGFLILFISITGYNGLYGQDSHEYLRYSRRLVQFISYNINPGDYFWPVNYPLAGALLSYITGPLIAMQLLPVLGAAWIIVLLASYLMNEFPGREREVLVYTLLFLGFSPYFFRYAVSCMSDIPALALTATAWYCIYSFDRKKNYHDLILASFATIAAIFTRFAMLPLLLPVLLLIIKYQLKYFKLLPFLISIFLIALPVILHVYFKQKNYDAIFHHMLISEWSFNNYFRNSFNTLDGISQYYFPNILFVLSFLIHPGFVLPGVLFLIILLVRKKQPSLINAALLCGVICYLLFLAGLPARNTRYLVAVLPFYLVFCFPSFLSLYAWFHYRKRILIFVFTLVIFFQAGLVYRVFISFYKLNKIEQQLSLRVISMQPNTVYTFEMDGALRTYGFHGTIINLWDRKIYSVIPGSIILFNRNDSEKQWRDRNPMINFNFLINSAKAKLIASDENGWEIYKIND